MSETKSNVRNKNENKVYAYVRTSTTDQTLEQQKQSITDHYAEGTEIVWFEEQLSGWSGKRPEYEVLKKLISKNQVRELVCFSVSRLGRNVQEASRLLQLCNDKGCKVQVLKENLDFSGPMGMAMFVLFGALAQMESDTKSQAIKAKFALKRQNEKWQCHGSPPHTVTEKIRAKSETIYHLHERGETNKAISQIVEVDERSVARVLKLKGFPLLTRAEYALLFPGWQNLKKDEMPTKADILKKWQERNP